MPERQIERVRKLALPHIVNRTRFSIRGLECCGWYRATLTSMTAGIRSSRAAPFSGLNHATDRLRERRFDGAAAISAL